MWNISNKLGFLFGDLEINGNFDLWRRSWIGILRIGGSKNGIVEELITIPVFVPTPSLLQAHGSKNS